MDMKTAGKIMGLGVVSGMRNVVGVAFVSRFISKHDPPSLRDSPLRRLGNPAVATLLTLFAAGEFAGDKTPFAPDRVAPGPLAGRMAAGALVGVIIARLRGSSTGAGALLGATSAAAGTFAAFHARRTLGQETPIPDALLALGEDALALGAGASLTADL